MVLAIIKDKPLENASSRVFRFRSLSVRMMTGPGQSAGEKKSGGLFTIVVQVMQSYISDKLRLEYDDTTEISTSVPRIADSRQLSYVLEGRNKPSLSEN